MHFIGAHMSISGGLDKAILDGESIHCNAIQIFTHSNRQWAVKPLTQEEINLFKKTWLKSSIKFIVVHASYLINCASSDTMLYQKSLQLLQEELKRCEDLSIPFLIMHPGAALTNNRKDALKNIANAINTTLATISGRTTILIENMAGQGSSLGKNFEELAQICALVHDKERIGICFDTCHAFASGYDFSTLEKYQAMWQLFDEIIGMDKLKAIHLNDSIKDFNSFVDRHMHIGEGKIGIDAFKFIMQDKKLALIPKILETPKDATLKDDIKNLATLNSLL